MIAYQIFISLHALSSLPIHLQLDLGAMVARMGSSKIIATVYIGSPNTVRLHRTRTGARTMCGADKRPHVHMTIFDSSQRALIL